MVGHHVCAIGLAVERAIVACAWSAYAVRAEAGARGHSRMRPLPLPGIAHIGGLRVFAY